VDDLDIYLADAAMFYSDKTAMLGVVTRGRPCIHFFFVDEVCSLMKCE
jgi:hypothetical protein